MPHPNKHTLSNGALSAITATDSWCNTVYSLNVDVPIKWNISELLYLNEVYYHLPLLRCLYRTVFFRIDLFFREYILCMLSTYLRCDLIQSIPPDNTVLRDRRVLLFLLHHPQITQYPTLHGLRSLEINLLDPHHSM
eukprot:TRINITY_DN3333_c0_g1_i1.p1 TRINITY_DN3333_c0_g1~~TRINITY_DN3333_c0_g1_i1.p1  ORF type:complete len:159 (-),score=4.82 TRINITY_DN3333_c0_g1_i1:22-432(-)